MAHVEADPLAGAALGEREQVVVLDDVAARLAVEAMRDDVSGREDFQHLVEERRRLADMDHERQACRILATFFATLTGVMPQAPRMTWLALTLMPMMTSRFASTQAIVRSMSMERMSMSSLTRLQATRPIEPMLRKARMRSRAGSITIFAEAVEIRLAGGPRIDDRRDAALDAAQRWPDRNVGAAMPHVRVQIDPARRNERAVAVDRRALRPVPSSLAIPPAIAPDRADEDVDAPCGCPLPKATGFTLDRKSGV